MLEHVKLIHGVLAADKKDLAEALKCVDDGENQGEKHGIPHLRRGDVAELLKRRSAVEIGGFVLSAGTVTSPASSRITLYPVFFQRYMRIMTQKAYLPFSHSTMGRFNAANKPFTAPFSPKKQIDEQDCTGRRHDIRKQKRQI